MSAIIAVEHVSPDHPVFPSVTLRNYSGKRWVPQRVKSLSTPSTSRLPPRCIVVSIGCIHASFRSRLMRDLNNIRVRRRGGGRERRWKVTSRFRSMRGPAPRKDSRNTRKRGRGRGEGSTRAKKTFVGPVDRSIFNETRSPPRYFFISTFPSFRDECARNAAAGTTPRRRCKKRGLCTRSLFYYTYTQSWEQYF